MALIGWLVNTAEADTYFTDNRPDANWAAVGADKDRYLNAAYIHISNHPALNVPTSPTAAQLTILKIAQCEQAWFLRINRGDQDHRKGVQVQGVIEALLVKEKYDKDMLKELPLAAIVWALLDNMKDISGRFDASNIDRDEDESVHTNATDF